MSDKSIEALSILGMDERDLFENFGEPSFKGVNTFGDIVFTFEDIGISATLNDTPYGNNVKSVRIMTPFTGEIIKDLKIGDTKEDVLRKCGKPLRERVIENEGFINWYFWEMFVSFEIENPDYVFGVTIYIS